MHVLSELRLAADYGRSVSRSSVGQRADIRLVSLIAVAFVSACSHSDAKSASSKGNSGNTSATAGAGGVLGIAGSSKMSGATSSGRGGSSSASSGAGGTSSSGKAGAGANSDAGTKTDAGNVPDGLLDSAITTRWNPGILADGQLHHPLGPDGLPVRSTICASPKPGDDLNAAIKSCPEGQVVQLAAGTYNVSAVVTLDKGVVLRGAGSAGAARGGTTIMRGGGGAVLAIGSAADSACPSGGYGSAYALTADAQKETTTVTLGSNAQNFAAGDLALLDEADDSVVQEGDCAYFKRVDHRSLAERVELASVDAAAGTVTLSTPLHWTFRSAAPHLAQIAKVKGAVVRHAGIESLRVQGGNNPGYDGQMAGGIDVSNAAYSRIKDVQTDETIGGMHVALTGAYRVVVRDGYFHHSANYGFGADCYGIVMRCGAADNLIENNIVRYMNKPVMFNASGGGNVIGYNYVDNSWATPSAWQEVNIDTHCSFPHMELMEGNYAPHMGATITHGNAGYLTYFRNYSSSQFAPPAVAGSTDKQTGNIAALQFDSGDVSMTVIGNVLGSESASDLGTAPLSTTYMSSGPDAPAIFELGDNSNHNGDYKTDVAYTTLWWHGNYDTVTPGVVWNPKIAVRTLPASLYLASRPAWWPSGQAFPWAGSDLSPHVGMLPAKARSDAGP